MTRLSYLKERIPVAEAVRDRLAATLPANDPYLLDETTFVAALRRERDELEAQVQVEPEDV